MRGLNTTISNTRMDPNTETWSAGYTDLPARIEDLREVEQYDPQYRGTTAYTHLMFVPFKHKGSAVSFKIDELITDNTNGTEYRIGSHVDAAGARHHLEVLLKRVEKE